VIEDKRIYHKNLMPVTYVTADIARDRESGLRGSQTRAGDRQNQNYGRLKDRTAYGGASLESRALLDEVGRRVAHYSEVFRDLGIAFAAVLILACGLVAGLFQSAHHYG